MQYRLLTIAAGSLAALLAVVRRVTGRLIDERGEGVISTAIAVLIIALIGAAMWVAFNNVWQGAEQRIQDSVNQIGG
ncbi:MAG: hypothetical protein GEU92_21455 [Alphaproteobacteria bacterium]|nr:hypothetical protein [Alphaproteobacteria bacterium]